jgi:hypothetical protein
VNGGDVIAAEEVLQVGGDGGEAAAGACDDVSGAALEAGAVAL